jgi:hypothetical protein
MKRHSGRSVDHTPQDRALYTTFGMRHPKPQTYPLISTAERTAAIPYCRTGRLASRLRCVLRCRPIPPREFAKLISIMDHCAGLPDRHCDRYVRLAAHALRGRDKTCTTRRNSSPSRPAAAQDGGQESSLNILEVRIAQFAALMAKCYRICPLVGPSPLAAGLQGQTLASQRGCACGQC